MYLIFKEIVYWIIRMPPTDGCFYNSEKKGYDIGTPSSDASAAMLAELKPSVLALSSGGFHAGSAVVLDQQDHAATDMHVALIGRQIQVRTPSGQMLDAQIEKLDVVKDLAILKVPGLNAAGAKAAKLDLTENNSVEADGRTVDQKAFTVGAPWAAEGRPMCVSEGTIQAVKSDRDSMTYTPDSERLASAFNFYDFFVDTHFGKNAEQFVRDNRAALIGRSAEWFSMPRVISDAVATNGISGGAMATSQGVKGIVQMGSPKVGSRSAPIKEFVDLAANPSRFNFQYDQTTKLLKSVLPANPSNNADAAEAQLANIILERNQKIVDETMAEDSSAREKK